MIILCPLLELAANQQECISDEYGRATCKQKLINTLLQQMDKKKQQWIFRHLCELVSIHILSTLTDGCRLSNPLKEVLCLLQPQLFLVWFCLGRPTNQDTVTLYPCVFLVCHPLCKIILFPGVILKLFLFLHSFCLNLHHTTGLNN